ncbi:hypothetical protein L828_3601 [Mycobacteroides abscessus MAB_030201_1061]|nr:hypothetical protein L828_3601 [Mycobacteroides abscessus MAB_030201_1061]
MWCRCPGPEPGLTPGQFRRDSPTLDQGGVPMVSSPPNPLVGNVVTLCFECAVDPITTTKTRAHRRYCTCGDIRGVEWLGVVHRWSRSPQAGTPARLIHPADRASRLRNAPVRPRGSPRCPTRLHEQRQSLRTRRGTHRGPAHLRG